MIRNNDIRSALPGIKNADLITQVLEKAHREHRNATELGTACGRSKTWAKHLLDGKIRSLFALQRASIDGLKKYLAQEDEILPTTMERHARPMRGPRNPRWRGGNSQYPDHATFKKNRIECLRHAGGKCEICGLTARVVHHKDENKTDHSLDNLIALCLGCHAALHTHDYYDLSALSQESQKECGDD